MTNREFYTAIANATNLPSELVDFATEAIAKMDNRNAARSSKPSKAAVANAILAKEMLSKMEKFHLYTASELATMMDFKTEAGAPSTSKATAVVKVLMADGLVEQTETKVPKRGKCKAYSIVSDAVATEADE